MNIAVFSRSTTTHFVSGGMETQLKNLVEGLSEIGHKVTVITTSYPVVGDIMKENKLENTNGVEYFYIGGTTSGLLPLTIFELPWKSFGYLDRGNKKEGTKNYFIESLKVFNELNLKNKFDVIISQSTGAQGVIGSVDTPVVSILHGTISGEIRNRATSCKTFSNWARFLLIDLPKLKTELIISNRRFFKKNLAIVSVSNILASQFLEEYTGSQKVLIKKKLSVIYNGVDSEKFSPSDTKHKGFKLLYVGRFDYEKGVDLIIKAVSELKLMNIDVTVDLIGGGIEEQSLKDLAKSLNVYEKFNFLGQISNDKLPKYYNAANLFVFPSRRLEGQPMTVAESFCCGLPVVATKSGGLSEIIQDSVNGVFIDAENYIDIADKIQALFVHKKRLEQMSKNARKSGLLNFSKVSMVKKYEKLLESISNGKTKQIL